MRADDQLSVVVDAALISRIRADEQFTVITDLRYSTTNRYAVGGMQEATIVEAIAQDAYIADRSMSMRTF